MILVVTINPLLEHRLIYHSVNKGSSNRNPVEYYQAGGKGINVSRQLNQLSIKNMSMIFLGGRNGKHLHELLDEEKINFTHTRISDNTRTSTVIIDNSAKIAEMYFGKNNNISESEADAFISKLEKTIVNCEMVVFSGSSPSNEADKIFPTGIEIANRYDKVSVLDTYGDHLANCLKASPTVVHNNVDEIESSLNIPLSNEEQKLEFLDHLYSQGVKQGFITNGSLDTYASNFEFHYKVQNPTLNSVDSTGSGDAFTAGIIYCWHHNHTFNEMLRFASSLGGINSTNFEVCNVQPADTNRLLNEIKITAVGKKIKIIDDTPR
ncbi:MAG: 1-phosphofructokinase [Ignavibacteriales bacterium]|nr:MAG: 1-phosphofructokinase [Ignavibacteriales bacterium]